MMMRLGLYYGTDLDTISAQHGDEGESYPGGNYFLVDGYDSLLNLFHDLLVQLNTRVSEINYRNGIRVSTNRGEFSADAAIITFPLGVLKKHSKLFNPPL